MKHGNMSERVGKRSEQERVSRTHLEVRDMSDELDDEMAVQGMIWNDQENHVAVKNETHQ